MATKSTVVLFIMLHSNKILVEKRPVEGFDKHLHLIPGGAINNLETMEEALKREMMEELGVVPIKFELLTNEKIIGVFDNLLKPFVVSEWEGTLPNMILDKQDPHPLEWVEIDSLISPIPGNNQIMRALKEYLSKL